MKYGHGGKQSSLHQSKPRKASQAPRQRWAFSEPGDTTPRPCSESTAPISSTGGKASWVFTLLLKSLWKGNFQRTDHVPVLSHIAASVQHYTFVWPMLELVALSLVFLPNFHSKIPSLKGLESVSQARLCIPSNPLFHKHPCPGAATWTITKNKSLSIWIMRECDFSCCRRFTYGIFSTAT